MEKQRQRGPPRARARRPWLVAAGFLLALAATVATVILTGLYVRAPSSDGPAGRPDGAQHAREAPAQRAAEPAGEARRTAR